MNQLQAIELIDFGDVKNFFGWSFVAGTLPQKLADEMVAGAKQALRNIQHNKPINIEAYKESADVARDNCSGIMYAYANFDAYVVNSINYGYV